MQRSSVAGMTKSRLPRGEGRILNHPRCDYDDCRQWKPAGKHKPGRVGLLAESWPTSFCCSDFSLLSRYATMIRGRGLWYREGTGDRDRGRRGATVHWRLQRKRGKNCNPFLPFLAFFLLFCGLAFFRLHCHDTGNIFPSGGRRLLTGNCSQL